MRINGGGDLGAGATPTPNMILGLPHRRVAPQYWKALTKSQSVFREQVKTREAT